MYIISYQLWSVQAQYTCTVQLYWTGLFLTTRNYILVLDCLNQLLSMIAHDEVKYKFASCKAIVYNIAMLLSNSNLQCFEIKYSDFFRTYIQINKTPLNGIQFTASKMCIMQPKYWYSGSYYWYLAPCQKCTDAWEKLNPWF